MHINALSGSPQVDKVVRPLESLGYVGLRQPGLELPWSQLKRLYVAAIHHHQANTPVYQQHMEDATRSAKHTEQVVRCPDARQKKLAIRTFVEAEIYDGLGSGIL